MAVAVSTRTLQAPSAGSLALLVAVFSVVVATPPEWFVQPAPQPTDRLLLAADQAIEAAAPPLHRSACALQQHAHAQLHILDPILLKVVAFARTRGPALQSSTALPVTEVATPHSHPLLLLYRHYYCPKRALGSLSLLVPSLCLQASSHRQGILDARSQRFHPQTA